MNKKVIRIIVAVVLLLAIAGVAYNFLVSAVYGSNTKNTVTYSVYWSDRVELDSILVLFKENEILKNESSFKLVAKQKDFKSAKPGHYLIKMGMSNNQIINMFAAGLQEPVDVSFIAQPNVKAFCSHVANQLRLEEEELYSFLENEFIKENDISVEDLPAYFIPNTYEFFWTVSPESFANRMLKEYQSYWNDNRKQLASDIGLSLVDVSTLASIVDGETHKKEEMATIAGLYLNRINQNIKLQSDPTVRYAIKEKKGQDFVVKRVLLEDLKIESDYNTYYVLGLPPGPLSIPSSQALNAVLHARHHNYIYMCANPATGMHDFTASYAEHRKNAKNYQKWLNNNKIKR